MDGAIMIYSASGASDDDDDKAGPLELVATLAILLLAWTRADAKSTSNGPAGTVIYAGVSDGTIRRYKCSSSSASSAAVSLSGALAKSSGVALLPSSLAGGHSSSSSSSSFRWRSTLRMMVESGGK